MSLAGHTIPVSICFLVARNLPVDRPASDLHWRLATISRRVILAVNHVQRMCIWYCMHAGVDEISCARSVRDRCLMQVAFMAPGSHGEAVRHPRLHAG